MSSAESNGDHVIAEYDGNNNLLRKYIYGPGIDQPVCMIEEGDADSPYYYHYDALGSVVALSDENGDTDVVYEYSVFGEVSSTDTDHTNPYMFAGRRYDIEIGLYYNRARYYNPYTGRFLQTDPIGHGDSMNIYAYCKNNPLNFVDPSGLLATTWGVNFSEDVDGNLVFDWYKVDPESDDFDDTQYDFIFKPKDASNFGAFESAVTGLWGLQTGENLLSKTRGLGITIVIQDKIIVNKGTENEMRAYGTASWNTKILNWDPTYPTARTPHFIQIGHELIHKYNDMVLGPQGRVPVPNTPELLAVEEARTCGYYLQYTRENPPGSEWRMISLPYDFRKRTMTENQLRIEANKAYGLKLRLHQDRHIVEYYNP